MLLNIQSVIKSDPQCSNVISMCMFELGPHKSQAQWLVSMCLKIVFIFVFLAVYFLRTSGYPLVEFSLKLWILLVVRLLDTLTSLSVLWFSCKLVVASRSLIWLWCSCFSESVARLVVCSPTSSVQRLAVLLLGFEFDAQHLLPGSLRLQNGSCLPAEHWFLFACVSGLFNDLLVNVPSWVAITLHRPFPSPQ